MKLELTSKDIFLLKLVCSALIVFLMFRFAVMPGVEHYQEKSEESRALEDALQEMRAAIEEIPALQQAVADGEAELKELLAPYYAHMENRQVDELLTGLALEAGLFPVSLSIYEPEPGVPAPYLYHTEAAVPEAAARPFMLVGTADFVFRGSEEQVFAFVDTIEENYPAIQVRSLNINKRVYLDEGWDVVEEPDVSMRLAIYMYDWDPQGTDGR